jgi:hypothetical protein
MDQFTALRILKIGRRARHVERSPTAGVPQSFVDLAEPDGCSAA